MLLCFSVCLHYYIINPWRLAFCLVFLCPIKIGIVRFIFFLFLFSVSCFQCVSAQDFDEWFLDKTLRLDYTFSGDNHSQHIYLDEMRISDNWYGRRVNLDSLLLLGNGQICMKDSKSGVALQAFVQYAFSGVADHGGGFAHTEILRKCIPCSLSQAACHHYRRTLRLSR